MSQTNESPEFTGRFNEAFDNNVEQLHRELENSLPISDYLKKYHELLELRVEDIERIVTIE